MAFAHGFAKISKKILLNPDLKIILFGYQSNYLRCWNWL